MYQGVGSHAQGSHGRQRQTARAAPQIGKRIVPPKEFYPEKVYSVVFIAPTQQGKSTTINILYEMLTGHKPTDVAVGDGQSSCTKSTKVLKSVAARTMQFQDFPPPPLPEAEKNLDFEGDWENFASKYRSVAQDSKSWMNDIERTPPKLRLDRRMPKALGEKLVERREDLVEIAAKQKYKGNVGPDQRLMINVGKPAQRMKLRLRFIDTPGLDDSDGGDDEFMAEVLQKMSAQGDADLLAFVFVTRVGAVWSGGFLEAAKRYWEQFPDLRSNWIFLHTAMNPHQDEEYKAGQNYEEACAMRKAALITELARAFGGSDGDEARLLQCQHIFIENEGLINSTKRMKEGSEKHAVQQLQLMERAKSVNRLLQAMSSNSPASMKDIPFLKSREIRAKDKELMGRIDGIKEGVNTTLKIVAGRLSANVAKHTELSQEKTDAQSELQTAENQLADKDKDGYECLRKIDVEHSGSWAFWAGWHEEVEITCHYPRMDHVCKAAIKSANYTSGDYDDASLEWDGGQIKWKPSVKSQIWCGVGYTFKLEVRFKDYYGDEIQASKTQIAELVEKIRVITRKKDEFLGQDSKDNKMIKILNQQTEALDQLQTDLNAEKKSVASWSKPGGYSQFYTWLGSLDKGEKRTPVNEILVRYGGVMQLERKTLDALVANFGPEDDPSQPPTAADILDQDVFGDAEVLSDADVISDAEVLDEPVQFEPFADLHGCALVQTPESCPLCGTRKSVFQCAAGCPFAVCLVCFGTGGFSED